MKKPFARRSFQHSERACVRSSATRILNALCNRCGSSRSRLLVSFVCVHLYIGTYVLEPVRPGAPSEMTALCRRLDSRRNQIANHLRIAMTWENFSKFNSNRTGLSQFNALCTQSCCHIRHILLHILHGPHTGLVHNGFKDLVYIIRYTFAVNRTFEGTR